MICMMESEMTNHEEKVEFTLCQADKFAKELIQIAPKDMLTLDILELTMAQLKIVLVLYLGGPAKMSDIAGELNVGLSTATGIIDRMVKLQIIERETDISDRRLVLCKLSTHGQDLLNNLWRTLRTHTSVLVKAIPEEQLVIVNQALEILSAAGKTATAKAEHS